MKTEKLSQTIGGAYMTADKRARISWELRDTENGPEFSATGEHDGGAGQCLEQIATAYPDDPNVQRIVTVWRAWHLNGLTAGTPEQEAFLRQREKAVPQDQRRGHYAWAVAELKAAGLHDVRLPHGHGLKATGGFQNVSDPRTHELIYRYGTRWIYRPIPDAVIAEIKSWSDLPQSGQSVGDVAADRFLDSNGIAIRITRSDTKPALWGNAGHHYRITLSGASRRLTFDFWGSVHDAKQGRNPSPYDVLSCLALDVNPPTPFADWCADYGANPDSLKDKQSFQRAHRFAQRLRAFFTPTEIDQLSTLN